MFLFLHSALSDTNISDLCFYIGEFSLRIFIVGLFGFIACTSFCLLFIYSCFTFFLLLTFADLILLFFIPFWLVYPSLFWEYYVCSFITFVVTDSRNHNNLNQITMLSPNPLPTKTILILEYFYISMPWMPLSTILGFAEII